MIELNLHISAEDATETLAELRHLCTVVNSAAGEAKVPVQIVGEEATVAEPAPKRTRGKKAAAAADNTALAAPVPAAPATAAPMPATAPAPVTVPPADPVAPATPPAAPKTYTLDEIARAGSALVDQGKMNDIMALMGKYGVEAITQLKDTDYPAFVEDLRAMGATV